MENFKTIFRKGMTYDNIMKIYEVLHLHDNIKVTKKQSISLKVGDQMIPPPSAFLGSSYSLIKCYKDNPRD